VLDRPGAAEATAQAIATGKLPKLEILDTSFTSLRDEGLALPYLQSFGCGKCGKLRVQRMACMDISTDGFAMLFGAVGGLPNLEELDLGQNQGLVKTGLEALLSLPAPALAKLRKLVLSGTPETSVAPAGGVAPGSFTCEAVFYAMLHGAFMSVEELGLSNRAYSPAAWSRDLGVEAETGLLSVLQALTRETRLSRVDLYGYDVSEAFREQLRRLESLGVCPKLVKARRLHGVEF
jgi:Leucine-rich repeat (LRR) protein